MSYPDPIEYCSLAYFANKARDCTIDCEAYQTAIKEWAKEKEDK